MMAEYGNPEVTTACTLMAKVFKSATIALYFKY